jgi:hypothetical protein
LGERALQELKDDNLIKFNYFLTDSRGRNVKAYMKMPIPSFADPLRKDFGNALIKHDISIDEYHSAYEKSSIPSNNSLSAFAIEIFEFNAALVTQYSKYRAQLYSVLGRHIQNGSIQESEGETFTIINEDAFQHKFDDIPNLMPNEKQEKSNRKSQPLKVLQQTTNPALNGPPADVTKSVVSKSVMPYISNGAENHSQDVPYERQSTEVRGIY